MAARGDVGAVNSSTGGCAAPAASNSHGVTADADRVFVRWPQPSWRSAVGSGWPLAAERVIRWADQVFVMILHERKLAPRETRRTHIRTVLGISLLTPSCLIGENLVATDRSPSRAADCRFCFWTAHRLLVGVRLQFGAPLSAKLRWTVASARGTGRAAEREIPLAEGCLAAPAWFIRLFESETCVLVLRRTMVGGCCNWAPSCSSSVCSPA